jgi:hypothetical protein
VNVSAEHINGASSGFTVLILSFEALCTVVLLAVRARAPTSRELCSRWPVQLQLTGLQNVCSCRTPACVAVPRTDLSSTWAMSTRRLLPTSLLCLPSFRTAAAVTVGSPFALSNFMHRMYNGRAASPSPRSKPAQAYGQCLRVSGARASCAKRAYHSVARHWLCSQLLGSRLLLSLVRPFASKRKYQTRTKTCKKPSQ